jgi:hypothetical protein
MIWMKYTRILIPVLLEGIMGKICPIIPGKLLKCLNLRSSRITSYPTRYGIGNIFEFKYGVVLAE